MKNKKVNVCPININKRFIQNQQGKVLLHICRVPNSSTRPVRALLEIVGSSERTRREQSPSHRRRPSWQLPSRKFAHRTAWCLFLGWYLVETCLVVPWNLFQYFAAFKNFKWHGTERLNWHLNILILNETCYKEITAICVSCISKSQSKARIFLVAISWLWHNRYSIKTVSNFNQISLILKTKIWIALFC